MSIKIQCPSCGKRRKVNERLAGRTIRCPDCESPIAIPQPVVQPAPVVRETVAVEAVAEPVAVEADRVSVSSDSVASLRSRAAAAGQHASGKGQRSAAERNGDAEVGSGAATALMEAPSEVPSVVVPAPDSDDDEELPPRKKRDDGELDMTPMVDVTFLLLIFFMVTASFSLQKSIQMPRQTSDLPSMSNVEEETEELDPVELEIDENGGFLVMAPEWERETPGKQNLTTALKEAIGDNRDGMKLNIKIHENAKLQFLVDGMDAGTIAGFTQLQVTEVDGFD